jgi:hypothetical protein
MATRASVERQKRRLITRTKARRWVRKFIKTHPCVDCGETDWRVIEFDHRDRALKKAKIADLITQGRTLERIKAEIALCEPRCANCHRRRTIKQLKWYRA